MCCWKRYSPTRKLHVLSCLAPDADVQPSHHHPVKASLINGSDGSSLLRQNQPLQRQGSSAVLACDALASGHQWHLQGDVQVQVRKL